jgi:uncharacterized protein
MIASRNDPSPPVPAGGRGNAVVDMSASPHARLRPLALDAVRLRDSFWVPRLRTIREVTLRQQHEQNEATGRIDNFRRAAGKKQTDFQGRYYNDSDVYKWLEAAAYALATESDPELERTVDVVIGEIAAAQSSDGYLNTYFTFERAAERWENLTRMHQLYCAGHLIQAAVAHHRATGKPALLGVATRFADLICDTFGPHHPGTDGHEEIELALVELFRETGDRRYLDQAAFFLDQRGHQPPVLDGSPYLQDHLPVREQREIAGHAVRATYLAIGMADVYAETGDAGLWQAVQCLWESAFTRKAYLTGGLGARYQGEAFGDDYELPNDRAYAETCAAIGGFLWNWRMLALTGEARYADWMETALYNGILSGISLDGTTYFYQNPLADRGEHRRLPWFGTACCPPNIARVLLSLAGFLYATSPEGIWVHHYVAGDVRVTLPSGAVASVSVETNYPWDGNVRLTLRGLNGATTADDAAGEALALFLRIPSWCKDPQVMVNGVPVGDVRPGTYVRVQRVWHEGDAVELHLPMPVRLTTSHPRVTANSGRVALQRGPLVYCVEAADHPGLDVYDLFLPRDGVFTTEVEPGVLGGITAIHGDAEVISPAGWNGHLYRDATETAGAELATEARSVRLTAVPYYVWANREPGPMQVWIRSVGAREMVRTEER